MPPDEPRYTITAESVTPREAARAYRSAYSECRNKTLAELAGRFKVNADWETVIDAMERSFRVGVAGEARRGCEQALHDRRVL
jgi:hypothetical protein